MAAVRDGDWRLVASYLYILHLDGPSLAWEYLRRNPEYQHDWHAGRDPQRWGLRLFENPALNAVQTQPAWHPAPDDLIAVHKDEHPAENALPFCFWQIPGRKLLMHDGEQLLLNTFVGRHMLRLSLSRALHAGMPYAYLLRSNLSHRALDKPLSILQTASAGRFEMTAPRPDRIALAHMRSLQALDGAHQKASHREIADVLFYRDDVAGRWHADSELRAQIRHLIKRGRKFMRGDYRRLLCVTHRRGRR